MPSPSSNLPSTFYIAPFCLPENIGFAFLLTRVHLRNFPVQSVVQILLFVALVFCQLPLEIHMNRLKHVDYRIFFMVFKSKMEKNRHHGLEMSNRILTLCVFGSFIAPSSANFVHTRFSCHPLFNHVRISLELIFCISGVYNYVHRV